MKEGYRDIMRQFLKLKSQGKERKGGACGIIND